MRLLARLLVVGAAAAASDFDGRMIAALEETLRRYPALPKSTEAVARYLDDVLWRPTSSVLVYEGRLFADRRFLDASEKNRKHANFMASVLRREHVRNVAYVFSGNSTGECAADTGIAPCWVIAKARGHAQRGVLVPNPYFHDAAYWEAVRSHVRARAATRPFASRIPRAFWRGHIRDSWHAPEGTPGGGDPCGDEFGNWARLSAVSRSVEDPDEVDVKCWSGAKCAPRDARVHRCDALPYTAAMGAVVEDPSIATDEGGHVAKENFTRYKYVLNLPGSTTGSYSRNLNHLWFLNSVVLFWDAPFVEWYFPALTDGVTHVVVNATTLAPTVRALEGGSLDAPKILEAAARVDEELVCPRCLAKYVRSLATAVRSRFNVAKVLDDPCLAAAFFRSLDCDGLGLVEIHSTVRAASANAFDLSKDRRRLSTSAASTPLIGTGCAGLAEIANASCGLNATGLAHHHHHHHNALFKALRTTAT